MISASLCIKCKGRLWCNLPTCPILDKFNTKKKVLTKIKEKKFTGSSPPALFVSWSNYPKVSVAPLSPPEVSAKTGFLDNPEKWFGLASSEIIDMRSTLIQPKKTMNVTGAANPSRELSTLQELAMSIDPVQSEFLLTQKPRLNLSFNDSAAPMGPIAGLDKIELQENSNIPAKVDYLYSDTAVNSTDAVQELFNKGLSVNYLSKVLSSGAFGVKKKRKLVPTRWSITAIDSNVSKYLIDEHVKTNQQINEFELYKKSYLGNHFFVLLVPANWSFEMLETWLPGAGWALFANQNDVKVICDFELFKGRKNYADNITGAYYAARLAVAEHLIKRNKNATAIIFRELTPDYSVPLGVWVIRETVRQALGEKPLAFSDFSLVLDYLNKRLRVSVKNYLHASTILDSVKKQKKLVEWV